MIELSSWMSGRGGFAAALRVATRSDRPIEPLLDDLVLIDADRSESRRELTAALHEAAAVSERHGAAAVLPDSSLDFAVLDPGGQGREAGPRLEAFLRDGADNLALRDLIRTAAAQGPHVRCLPTADGDVMVVYAASAAQARRWPLPQPQRRRIEASPHWIVLVAISATRSPGLEQELASLFDLTPGEARVVAALLSAPTVEVVARRLGASVASTRDALDRARQKIGCRNSSAMTRRVLDALLGGPTGVGRTDDAESVRTLLDLTLSEAKVALLVAEGLSAGESALRLGVGVETVKSHLRSTFGKVGVNRSRDLARVVVETRTLDGVRRAAEVVTAAAEPDGRLRLLSVADHRTVAFIDYGGAPGSRLLLVCHGFAGGRTLPPRFVALLQDRGWRPLVPQRPGFGLTDPTAPGRYFDVAADDMAAIASALRCETFDVLARDSAAPALMALCDRHPGRVTRAALLNPKAPRGSIPSSPSVLAACSRFLTANPTLIAPFLEMLRRQCSTELLQRVLVRSCADAPSDAAAIADPEVMRRMVTDIQALLARSSVGAASEQSAYAAWTPRPVAPGTHWSVGFSVELSGGPPPDVWRKVLGVAPAALRSGGYLTQFTDPELLMDLLSGATG